MVLVAIVDGRAKEQHDFSRHLLFGNSDKKIQVHYYVEGWTTSRY
ncbi:hypothetical protein LX73_1550 [Fodinibius salinus]|uniref:Uncharacterized protein n=1 Tax=Fodinibius salinus TaxID=860790 RepID=A0A5D3YMB9_9BACT|nr:hypothetical protein LX73_1550 [Fodinibius salinus]